MILESEKYQDLEFLHQKIQNLIVKNWMPIEDLPYHYVKWSNPAEIVKIDPDNNTCTTVHLGTTVNLPRDVRGGSQVIAWELLHCFNS